MSQAILLDKLEEVLNFFEDISQIPRGPGNEKECSDYLVDFAKKRNLWVHQDKAFNVIIKKDGTNSLKEAPPVILQAHIDMVCEKNKDSLHDFTKDPLSLEVEGDFIMAKGTTLGADNGLGMGMIMALLDSGDITHPPIEALFTTEEEVGLIGAAKVDFSLLEGKRLINLDSSEEGIFTIGCAGGVKLVINVPIYREETPEDCSAYLLQVKGLQGGHSGMDIDKGRGNANRILARVLYRLSHEYDVYFQHIGGGLQDNAIPREAEAVFVTRDKKTLGDITAIKRTLEQEYKQTDSGFALQVQSVDVPEEVLTKDSANNVILSVLTLPEGVLYAPGPVETSCNIGVVKTEDTVVKITCSVRAVKSSKKNYVMDQIKAVAEFAGAIVQTSGDYPGWESNLNSPLLDIFADVYKEIAGEAPVVTSVHAGLECGVFSKRNPELDMISIGPDIIEQHSPGEKASISSLARTWEFLKEVLKRFE